eukprot:6849-Rhodomonas_salina.3
MPGTDLAPVRAVLRCQSGQCRGFSERAVGLRQRVAGSRDFVRARSTPLSAYARATRCPVTGVSIGLMAGYGMASATRLRACYAISRTEIACYAIEIACYAIPRTNIAHAAFVLCAIPGEAVQGHRRQHDGRSTPLPPPPLPPYARATRCPVLT